MRPGAPHDPKKYTFEEENERDIAIRKVQRCYQMHRARMETRTRAIRNYCKLYDRENDIYFYKNKTTGATSANKPLCLGSGDLDMPKIPRAPEDYNAGYIDAMPEGHFLGIFSSTFPRSGGRLKEIEKRTMAERDALAELMPHDFICRWAQCNTLMRSLNCEFVRCL